MVFTNVLIALRNEQIFESSYSTIPSMRFFDVIVPLLLLFLMLGMSLSSAMLYLDVKCLISSVAFADLFFFFPSQAELIMPHMSL